MPATLNVLRNQTANFTLSYTAASAGGSGSITVTASGNVFLVATVTFTVNSPAAAVSVSPTNGTLNVGAGQLARAAFTLNSTGGSDAQVRLTASCAGSAFSSGSCEPAMDGVWLSKSGSPSASTIATVAFRGSVSGGTGTVVLVATNAQSGATFGTGTINVTTTAPSLAAIEVPTFEAGTMLERSRCLSIAIVRDVASQCEMLRVLHPLPSVRVRNQLRAPTLVYGSDFVYAPNINVNVTLAPSTATPDSVKLIVQHLDSNGVVNWTYARVYPGADWALLRSRRLSTQAVSGVANTVNRYHVEVQLLYANGWQAAAPGVDGELVFVQHWGDAIGSGWWIEGVERIFPRQYDGSILWVGGDGSFRKFVSAHAVTGGTMYISSGVDGVDSLMRTGTGDATRYAVHGARVCPASVEM